MGEGGGSHLFSHPLQLIIHDMHVGGEDEIPRLLFAQHSPLQIPQIQNKTPVADIKQFID